jgi:hypothetical protein
MSNDDIVKQVMAEYPNWTVKELIQFLLDQPMDMKVFVDLDGEWYAPTPQVMVAKVNYPATLKRDERFIGL